MRPRNEIKEQAVIDNAIDLIVKSGIDGFSMNKLAKAAGISAATLYIYYKDRDDLVRKIGVDLGKKFFTYTQDGFSADMPFEAGLWKQWENRMRFSVEFPKEVACFEIIRHSNVGLDLLQESFRDFKDTMQLFFTNAVENKQLIPLPVEIFWSVAYGPLYSLLRFHGEGKSMGGKPFSLDRQTLEQTFRLVIKALKP